MCFSATASFVTAACLGLVGAACVQRAQPHARLLALVPVLFAVQQCAEGILWVALTYKYNLLIVVMPYLFLFFAFFVWPALLPAALYQMEQEPKRKAFLNIIRYVGIALSFLLYGYTLIIGTSAHIQECHINYTLDIGNRLGTLATIWYLVCTVGAGLLSSRTMIQLLALCIAGAYAITYYAYYTYLVSVWCFFAALLSALVYLIIRDESSKK